MVEPTDESGASAPHVGRPRVVLGVAGGIAAYKSCELVRLLTESGHDVIVVPTPSALRFVGAPTWEALTGHPVSADVFTAVHEVRHVRLGQEADLVLVAPATADLLARAVHGRADDLLAATLLVATCPVVMAPAMHTEMWQHPATRANVATLRSRGVVVLEPAVGRLTGPDSGVGRLPDPAEIFSVAIDVLRRGVDGQDLAGRRVVVSAGGSREFLDPVRFLGNASSGRQGYALASAAVARGADVTVVAANVSLPDPAGAKVVPVVTTAELADAVTSSARGADAVVMAAAPADYAPADPSPYKIKKADRGETMTVDLRATTDVLAVLVGRREPGQVLVGFAAETGDQTGSVLDHGRAKLERKGCDLLVVNDVAGGAVFGAPDNAATIIGSDGSSVQVPQGPKSALAHAVWDQVSRRWVDHGE